MSQDLKADPVDFLVKVGNPRELDMTLSSMLPHLAAVVVGMGVEGGPVRKDDCYVVRVFSDPGFFEFACQSQGYCQVIRRLEELV